MLPDKLLFLNLRVCNETGTFMLPAIVYRGYDTFWTIKPIDIISCSYFCIVLIISLNNYYCLLYLTFRERKIIDWIYCLLVLVMLSGLCYGGLQATSSLIQPVSRRMANLSFVLWIVSNNNNRLSWIYAKKVCLILMQGW